MTGLRITRTALVGALALAVVLLVSVATTGALSSPGFVVSVGGTEATIGLYVDVLAATLLVLVVGVGALSAAFSVRYLTGGHRLHRYAVIQLATVLGLALTVTAASLPLLVVGWTLAGLALSTLVAHAGTAQATRASRLVRGRLLVGDSVLLAGVAVAGVALPSLDRSSLAQTVPLADPLPLSIAALLVIAGAAVRSALIPAHRWLPETAEAPTPVSALLHAGLVNGVGIVGVLAWPLLAASWPALVALVLLGAVTAVVGTLLGRPRPDTKGRLAASTTAQMGYLAMQVGLALPAAALFHLIGHALYKATLFLGAGSSIAQARKPARSAPTWRTTAATTALTALLTSLVTLALYATWPQADKGVAGVVPLALAAGVAGLALARVLSDRSTPTRGRVLAATGVLGALGAFLVALLGWTAAFSSSFAVPVSLSSAGLAALVVLVVLIGGLGLAVDVAVQRGRLRPLAVRVAMESAAPRRPLGRWLGQVVAGEPRQPADTDVARTQVLVQLAEDVVGPSWPLAEYVAANPVAGLERLSYPEALQTASATWGDRADISDEVFRRYYAAGRIRDEHLGAAIGERPDRTLVRSLLLSDARETLVPDEAVHRAIARLRVDDLPEAPVTQWTCRTAVEALDEALDVDLVTLVDAQTSLWSALVHGSRSAWLPRSSTLFTTWRDAMATGAADASMRVHGAGQFAASLPERSDVAVALLLDRLDVPHKQRLGYLARVLARTPGWAAHQAWRAAQHHEDNLADLLAMRLAVEAIVVEAVTTASFGSPARWPELMAIADGDLDWSPIGDPVLEGPPRGNAERLLAEAAGALGWDERDLDEAAPADLVAVIQTAASLPAAARIEIWQAALERGYSDGLLNALRPRSAGAHPARPQTVRAQVVTCIDVRSERLRRHLEKAGDIETLGFAGFFGVPFSLVDESGLTTAQCPVLISPANTLRAGAPAVSPGSAAAATAGGAFAGVQQAPLLPLVLAEASGWAMGVGAAVRTGAPRLADRWASPDNPGAGPLALDGQDGFGFSHTERVYLAEAALRGMGLVEKFAPVIVLLGHAAHVTNNPFASGYDCGACGGNGGLANARAAAAVLNDGAVRDALRERGIDIPDATVVIPGLHETTRDRIALLPEVAMTDEQRDLLRSVEHDFDRASAATTAERLPRLPDVASPDRARRQAEARAGDWSQTRPEWGLVGNAALIVGPRELTRGLDLDGRTFLHSYRPEADPEGAALEVILTAPLVVAQWINSGYAFATLDQGRFGAGDKVLHNPVGAIGVQTGAHGDLRLGLPLQGVTAGTADPSGLPAHEPMRLMVVVSASREAVGEIVDRQPVVRRLLTGRWIMLVVLEPGSPEAWRWTDAGWVEASPASVDVAQRRDETAEVAA